MINICLPLHDQSGNYSKYVGVVICSILENTKEKITFFILHDETLTEDNKINFKKMIKKYRQKIFFYNVNIEDNFKKMKSIKKFSIGTLFRLKIAEILPFCVDKVIYLDADILVNLDIKELWKFDLKGNSIGASLDLGYTGNERYFNAGVLLIDLKKIRKNYNFFEECIIYFSNNPNCILLDQDALNFIFKKDVKILPNEYNSFVWIEKDKNKKVEKKIYHYTSGIKVIKRINDINIDCFDRLFYSYLFKTPWGTSSQIMNYYINIVNQKNEIITFHQNLIKKISYCKKVFWGVSGKIHEEVLQKFTLNENDYFVDSDEIKQGEIYKGKIVKSPDDIIEDLNNIIIIITTLKYFEVKNKLEGLGLIENKDFFEGEKLLLNYNN